MTLADFLRSVPARPGLSPPPATPGAILADLRLQWAHYREDDLPARDRVAFLGLRIVQRLAYNLGWFMGRAQ